VRCAHAVQSDIAGRDLGEPRDQRIAFRIGINVWDIVEKDGDIFGDGVNIAARLEGIAEAGGICVSARVQEDVAGRVDVAFEDMGEQTLKNIARQSVPERLRLQVLTRATRKGPLLGSAGRP
jgi:class 3 adenylate cyclase